RSLRRPRAHPRRPPARPRHTGRAQARYPHHHRRTSILEAGRGGRMSPRNTIFTARRVLEQLSHDHRTLALILFVPSILLIIFKYTFDHQSVVFDQLAPMILGIFPLVLMFIVTSIATLRERTIGTLDRLLTM